MKKEIRKLYNGNVDINSLVVEDCIKKQEPLIVIHNGDRMILSPNELITKRVSISKKIFESKYQHVPNYRLFSYEWIPEVVKL